MPSKFDFISPGIQLNEIDESVLPVEVEDVGPLLIGPALKGPGMKPVRVSNLQDFYSVFGKPITSGWLLSNYLFINEIGIHKFIKFFSSDNIFWKFITMGYDYKYMIDEYKKIGEINNNTILKKTGKIIVKILLYIFVAFPFLNWYNNSLFGLTLSPSYYNLISQAIFLLNIIGNIYIWKKYTGINKENSIHPLGFNIMYFLVIGIIIILYYIIKIFLIK